VSARAICGAGALALSLLHSAAAAQTAQALPGGSSTRSAVAVDRADQPTLEDIARTIAALERRIAQQDQEIAELRRQLAQVTSQSPTQPAVTQDPAVTPAPLADPKQAEQGHGRVPELPRDVVSAGEFPGSVKIPGTDAAIKIGGLVRVNWVSTNDALSVTDRFVTSAIPVADDAARGARVDVIASPSRFNFDLRTPTGVGYMRAFIEGDFAGANGSFRLRHAYGQWKRAIFGQTWSTFSDPEAEPDGIDFEGLNAIVLFRQPQIRWSFAPGERTRLAIALEDPRAELTGANPVSQVPDVVARVRVQPVRGGHVQVAAIYRSLRGEPVDEPTEIVGAPGYGANVSGRLAPPWVPERDRILFQSNAGAGLGHYITDLSSAGGQDAVFNPVTHTLEVLRAYSGYIGYEHWWTERVRSSFSFGIVTVRNEDIQPDDALHLTRRYSANIMWSPIPRLDLVTEFLFGSRTNKNGQRGSAAQTQIGSTFRF